VRTFFGFLRLTIHETPEMERSIFSRIDASVICLVLFILMLLTVALGNKIRKKFWNSEDGDTKGGVNSLLGALFGLWGFMLAFTFGQSGNRFENVRSMIVDEANILRTTILKADFFPDSVRDAYRADLRTYLEERIAYYDLASDETKFDGNREEISKAAIALWTRTIGESKKPGMSGLATDMSTSLTSLFDIGIKREVLLRAGIPQPITFMLIGLALSICFVGGFTTPTIKRKEWIVVAVFALLACAILYITIDLARPTQGLIKPDAGEKTIISLRKLF